MLRIRNEHMKNSALPFLEATFYIENDFFREAKDYCRENQITYNTCFPVLNNEGKLVYILEYVENIIYSNWCPGGVKDAEFAKYDFIRDMEKLDYSLLDRYDAYIFEVLEEYTYAIAELIQLKYPYKRVVFLDEAVKLLNRFEYVERELLSDDIISNCVRITSDNTIYEKQNEKEAHVYCSLNVMYSLVWCMNCECFGTRNREKTIFLADFTPRTAGLYDFMKYALYYKQLAHQRGWLFAIDYSKKPNQYLVNENENMWEYFFESISTVSLEETYNSYTVIRASTNQIDMVSVFSNLYIRECMSQYDVYSIMEHIKFNMETRTYINELIPREIRDNARVLGVIARGTDYRNEANEMIGRSVRIPDIEDVINRCKELMITWKCDYVFIASEDAEFFDKLKEAFGSKAIYIEQKRVQHDYTQSYRSIAELLEIQNEKEYGRRYLAIIQALANCTVLLTNRTSGACSAALGLNNHNYEHYELVRCRV